MFYLRKGRPNVVFIVLDTLRADCTRQYGGRLSLPNIDRIGRNSTIYDNAVAPGTYTLTSHVSLFTGKRVRKVETLMKDPIANYYDSTDPLVSKNKYIGSSEMTLARRMSYLGYKTALFSNNPFVGNTTGLGEGFSHVVNTFMEEKLRTNKAALNLIGNDAMREGLTRLAYFLTRMMPKDRLDKLYIGLRNRLNKGFGEKYGFYKLDQGAEATNRLIGRYLSRNDENDHFIFVNYMEPHEGYPTNLVTDRYVDQDKWLYVSNIQNDNQDVGVIREAYRKRIEYMDGQLGRLIGTLKSRGILDNAVLILASDHGQSFMEHGQMYHTLFPYEQISHVPLMTAKFENGKQVNTRERVGNPVSFTALYDSVMNVGYQKSDVINGELRKDNYVFCDHTGISEVWDIGLLRLLKARSKYADEIYRAKLAKNVFASAIYYKDYKLIHYYNKGTKDELYNIRSDPEESENVLDRNKGMAYDMLKADSAS